MHAERKNSFRSPRVFFATKLEDLRKDRDFYMTRFFRKL